MDQSRDERACHAEEEAEEHEYVDTDGSGGDILLSEALRRSSSGAIGLRNELGKKCNSLRTGIRKKGFVSLDKK